MHRFCFLGTDIDRHGPVQEDDHGAFRSATGLIAFGGRFLHFLTPVKSDGSLYHESWRVIAFDDNDSFGDTCECLATANRRHVVHPLYTQPATTPAPYGQVINE